MGQKNSFLATLPISSTSSGLKVSGSILIRSFCLRIVQLPALLSPNLRPDNIEASRSPPSLTGLSSLRPPATYHMVAILTDNLPSVKSWRLYQSCSIIYSSSFPEQSYGLFKVLYMGNDGKAVSYDKTKYCKHLSIGRYSKYGKHLNNNCRKREMPPHLLHQAKLSSPIRNISYPYPPFQSSPHHSRTASHRYLPFSPSVSTPSHYSTHHTFVPHHPIHSSPDPRLRVRLAYFEKAPPSCCCGVGGDGHPDRDVIGHILKDLDQRQLWCARTSSPSTAQMSLRSWSLLLAFW